MYPTSILAEDYNLSYEWISHLSSDYGGYGGFRRASSGDRSPKSDGGLSDLRVSLNATAVPGQWVGVGFSGGPGMVRRY